MQAKYERIILASLQGYCLYLQKLTTAQIKEAEKSNKKLLSHPKFWKYSKNKIALIRTCFFRTLICICQNAQFLLLEESSNLSSAIFNNLEETDPVVLQSVWGAALNVLITLEDCWSHINLEKQLVVKLFSILKAGGRNVFTIYPNILPLLSKLPISKLNNKEVFFDSFLENMERGIEINLFSQSIIEGKLMANTFVECFKFIILQNIMNAEFCSAVIVKHLAPVSDKLFEEKIKEAVKMPFWIQIACLVQSWHKNSVLVNSVYANFLNDFFDSLLPLFINRLDTQVSQSLIDYVLENQVQFLNILLHPDQFMFKSKDRVKFADVNQAEEKTEIVTKSSSEFSCSEQLNKFINELVNVYFKNAIHRKEKRFIQAIKKIIDIFLPKLVFEQMVLTVQESTYFKLFSSYFSKWLIEEEMKCDELISISFNLLSFVTSDERQYILEELSNSWLTDSLQCSVCNNLLSYSNNDYIITWVKSEKFSKSIYNLINRYINGSMEEIPLQDSIVALLMAKNDKKGL